MSRKNILRIATAILTLTAIFSLVFLYTSYQKNKSYLNLLSDIPSKPDIEQPPAPDLNEENLTPGYLELLSDIVDTELFVVSTGKLSDFTVKSSATGEQMGNAIVLNVIAKDSAGSAKNLQIIVQIFLKSDPNNDLIPWVANIASYTEGLEEYSDNPKTYSLDELSRIFSENSVWSLTPLIDFDAHKGLFARENQEYVFFARQYYGESISTVKEFVESGLDKDGFNRPLILMTLEWVK